MPDIGGNETRSDDKVVAKKVALDDHFNNHLKIPISQSKHSREIADTSVVSKPSSLDETVIIEHSFIVLRIRGVWFLTLRCI